jgi:hypothetical protein
VVAIPQLGLLEISATIFLSISRMTSSPESRLSMDEKAKISLGIRKLCYCVDLVLGPARTDNHHYNYPQLIYAGFT